MISGVVASPKRTYVDYFRTEYSRIVIYLTFSKVTVLINLTYNIARINLIYGFNEELCISE